MPGADSTVLSGLEKDYFEKMTSEGVNNKFPFNEFWKSETTDADYVGGGGHIWGHHVGRNVSPMFVREGSAFAAAGAQRHIKGRIGIKKMMARLYMTAEAMEFYNRSEASYANAVTDEKTRLVDDISYREEYAAVSDGRGVLALLSDDPGTTTDVDVDSPANISGSNFGNRFIQRDMFVGAVNPATGALRAGIAQVADVASDGTDFTSAAAIDAAWADNDYIVQAANGSVTSVLDTSYEAATWGLPALVDDGTNRDDYYGISRADAPSLKSYVVASAGAFSLDLAQRTADVVNAKLGGEVDMLIMHPSVRREYIKLLNADRRYTSADLKRPDGGTVAMKQGDLTLGEIPVKAIRSIGLAQVYFLDTKKSKFKTYVAEPGKFEQRDGGSIWVRDGSGNSARHAFEAWWYSWKQNFCENPGMNARWDGVTGQSLVVVRSE